jgi:hypothetical protein
MPGASPTQGEGHACSGARIPADDGAISVVVGPAGRGGEYMVTDLAAGAIQLLGGAVM